VDRGGRCVLEFGAQRISKGKWGEILGSTIIKKREKKRKKKKWGGIPIGSSGGAIKPLQPGALSEIPDLKWRRSKNDYDARTHSERRDKGEH